MSKNSTQVLRGILTTPEPGRSQEDQLRADRHSRGERLGGKSAGGKGGKDKGKGKDKKTK